MPGHSDWDLAALTFPEIFALGLRQFASTRLHGTLRVWATGVVVPHCVQILAWRASPQNPLRNGAPLCSITPAQDKCELQNRPPRRRKRPARKQEKPPAKTKNKARPQHNYAPFGARISAAQLRGKNTSGLLPVPARKKVTVWILGRSGRFLPGAGQGRARLRVGPPRGFEIVTGSHPRQAATALLSMLARPRALFNPSSFFVRILPAGVQPGLGQSNRSPPAADSPPCPRRSASRIQRCPGCTCAPTRPPPDRRGMLFIPLSPSAAYAAHNPDAGLSGAPGGTFCRKSPNCRAKKYSEPQLTFLTTGNIFLPPSGEVPLSIDDIQTAITEVLKEVQRLSGHTWTDLRSTDKPIEDLDGFDSLTSVETTVMVEEKLGCGELGTASIFVSEDGKRALTLQESAQLIMDFIGKNGRNK